MADGVPSCVLNAGSEVVEAGDRRQLTTLAVMDMPVLNTYQVPARAAGVMDAELTELPAGTFWQAGHGREVHRGK